MAVSPHVITALLDTIRGAALNVGTAKYVDLRTGQTRYVVDAVKADGSAS